MVEHFPYTKLSDDNYSLVLFQEQNHQDLYSLWLRTSHVAGLSLDFFQLESGANCSYLLSC